MYYFHNLSWLQEEIISKNYYINYLPKEYRDFSMGDKSSFKRYQRHNYMYKRLFSVKQYTYPWNLSKKLLMYHWNFNYRKAKLRKLQWQRNVIHIKFTVININICVTDKDKTNFNVSQKLRIFSILLCKRNMLSL